MHAPPAPFQGRIQELPPPAAAPAQKKKPTSKKSKTTTSSKKQRGGQFDTKELKSFFNTMEKILPIGFREWEVVLKEHNKDWSVKEREVRGLRQKFNRLNASKLPTGDPNCPWDVKWAKQLKRKIDEKADANLLNDVSEAEDDDDAGDEEDATTPVEDDDEAPTTTNNNNNNTSSSSSDDMMITPTNLNRSKDNFGRTISAHMSRNKSKRKYSNNTSVSPVDDTSSSMAEFMQMQLLMERKKEEREEKRRQTEREEDRRREDRMMMMMMAMMSGNKQMMEDMMTRSTTRSTTNDDDE